MKDKEQIREGLKGSPKLNHEPAGCEAEVVYPIVGAAVPATGTRVEDLLEREDGHPTLQEFLVGTEERRGVVLLHQQCGGRRNHRRPYSHRHTLYSDWAGKHR